MKSKTKWIVNTLLFGGIVAILVAIALPQFAAYRGGPSINTSYSPPIYNEVEVCPTYAKFNTEAYDYLQEHPFLKVEQNPLSSVNPPRPAVDKPREVQWVQPGRDITKIMEVDADHDDPLALSPRERLMEVCPETDQLIQMLQRMGFHVEEHIQHMEKLLHQFGPETFRTGVLIAIKEKKPVAAELSHILKNLNKEI